MRIQISLEPAVTGVLLCAVIVLNAFSFFSITSLDLVVNTDLYNYGLSYDEGWSIVYQQYLHLIMIAMTISMFAIGFAILFVLAFVQTQKHEFKIAIYGFLVASVVATVLSAFFFGRLDQVVHSDLYKYGLAFDYQWANRYWTYARSALGLDISAIAAVGACMAFVFLGARTRVEVTGTKAISCVVSLVGVIALALSVNYGSQVLALIGLGLTFWGLLLIFVSGEAYVKKHVSEAAVRSPLVAMNTLLSELGSTGNPVYLPPKYVGNLQDSRMYLARDPSMNFHILEQVLQKNSVFVKEPEAVLLTPPGDELTKLLERRLGIGFAKMDLPYLEKILSRLLTEDFEIAEYSKIVVNNDAIYVTLKGSVYGNVFRETTKLAKTPPFACPISSALACIFAKASGKPVIISKSQASQDGRVITLEYRLLNSPEAGEVK